MRLELVRDWMSRDVITVTPGTSVPDAGRLMVDHTIRRLPVVSDGSVVGILTYNDLRNRRAADTDSQTVADVMTASPLTIGPDETIGAAAEVMLRHHIGCLPVVDAHDRLVGIITESDIFKLVARHWMAEQGGPEPYSRYD